MRIDGDLERLERKFVPLEFNQLVFKSPQYDYCSMLATNLYDFHGKADMLVDQFLTRANFKAYLWLRVLL